MGSLLKCVDSPVEGFLYADNLQFISKGRRMNNIKSALKSAMINIAKLYGYGFAIRKMACIMCSRLSKIPPDKVFFSKILKCQ